VPTRLACGPCGSRYVLETVCLPSPGIFSRAAPVAGAGERAEADALATAQLAEVDGLVGVAAGGGAGVAASSDTIYNVKAVDNGKAIEDVLAFDMLVKDTTYEETNSATERRSEGEAALTNKLVKATTYEEITEEPQRSEQDMDAEIGTEIQRRSEGATMEFQSLSAADLGSTDSEPFPILPSSIVGLTCKLVKETTYKEISEGTQKYEGGMNRVIDTEIQRRFEGDAKEFQGHSGKALETTYYDINSETERRSEGNMMGIQSSSIEALGVTDSEPCPLPSSTEAAIPFKLVEETTYEEISEETQRSEGDMNAEKGTEIQRRPEGGAKEIISETERRGGTADEKGQLGAQHYFIGEPVQGRGRGRRAEDPGRGGQRPHRDGESDTAPDEVDLERLSGTADEKGKLGAQYFIGELEQGRGRGRRAEDPGPGGQRPHRDVKRVGHSARRDGPGAPAAHLQGHA
jgi:hypothetical protein